MAPLCPPKLKVRTPAHAKHLGWYLEFEFRVTQTQSAVRPTASWRVMPVGLCSGSKLGERGTTGPGATGVAKIAVGRGDTDVRSPGASFGGARSRTGCTAAPCSRRPPAAGKQRAAGTTELSGALSGVLPGGAERECLSQVGQCRSHKDSGNATQRQCAHRPRRGCC